MRDVDAGSRCPFKVLEPQPETGIVRILPARQVRHEAVERGGQHPDQEVDGRREQHQPSPSAGCPAPQLHDPQIHRQLPRQQSGNEQDSAHAEQPRQTGPNKSISASVVPTSTAEVRRREPG
jgi:hypothetical protein